MTQRFSIITLFPDMFAGCLAEGVMGRAVKSGLVEVDFFNPRDYTHDKHRTVDDRPYGGGPGMLMMVQPLTDAINAAKAGAYRGVLIPTRAQVRPSRCGEFNASRSLNISGWSL